MPHRSAGNGTEAVMEPEEKELQLKERLIRIHEMEEEIAAKEKALKDKEKEKKQILLRLSSSLWSDLASWADEDFRSINGQIEFLLAEAVRKHKGGK